MLQIISCNLLWSLSRHYDTVSDVVVELDHKTGQLKKRKLALVDVLKIRLFVIFQKLKALIFNHIFLIIYR